MPGLNFSITVLILSLISAKLFAWGELGHKITAEIAIHYLNDKTKSKVLAILEDSNLRAASVWPDKVRSNPRYRKYSHYHYATVAHGENYQKPTTDRDGLMIEKIKEIKELLEKGQALQGFTKAQTIKWLIHLIGDLHQPLHIGRPGLKGGNKVAVKFRGRKTNLHKLWDSRLLLKSEMGRGNLKVIVKSIIKKAEDNKSLESRELEDWVNESLSLRGSVYDFGELENIKKDSLSRFPYGLDDFLFKKKKGKKTSLLVTEKYELSSIKIIKKRLFLAGYRIANVLNSIEDKL